MKDGLYDAIKEQVLDLLYSNDEDFFLQYYDLDTMILDVKYELKEVMHDLAKKKIEDYKEVMLDSI